MITREGGHNGEAARPAMQQVFPSQPGRSRASETSRSDDRSVEMPDALTADGERFLDRVFQAAAQAGCELLFEIPAALFNDPSSLSAAMRRRSGNGSQLFFIVFNAGDGTLRIIEEIEVSPSVLEFTRSYAGVLGLIASDKRLTTPLLQ